MSPEPKRYLIDVEVEAMEEGGFLAVATNLQGAHAEGDSIAEALSNLEDVARVIIELCREDGVSLPPEFIGDPDALVTKAEILVRA